MTEQRLSDVIPADSRYIPFTQQKFCCVPTCLSMVMYRHEIPLVPVELLGHELGLTVPEEDTALFWNARSGDKPIAGWGTRINEPQYEPNAALGRLGIPLSLTVDFIDNFASPESLTDYLRAVEQRDGDVLVSFDNGVLFNPEFPGGHVCVFDRITDDGIRLIDSARNVPKWPTVTSANLFEAMRVHGSERSGGFWRIAKTGEIS